MRTTFAGATLDATPVDHGVTVRWFASGQDADEALRGHVGSVVGVDADEVKVGRLCGRCGSSDHGRPWASHGVHVSLSRSGPHLVTAVSTVGPVGVDVESVSAVDRGWEDVAGHVEPSVDDVAHGAVPIGTGRAAQWCRTEAVLKRDGTGFAVGPDPHSHSAAFVDDLVAPAGYCAAVAYDDPLTP